MISSSSIIIRKSLGLEAATLGIRAAWAMMTNGGQEVKIICMGDGVYAPLGKGGYVRDMFERFLKEGGEVYVVQEDATSRGVVEAQLPSGVQFVPGSDIGELVDDTDAILTF